MLEKESPNELKRPHWKDEEGLLPVAIQTKRNKEEEGAFQLESSRKRQQWKAQDERKKMMVSDFHLEVSNYGM